MTRFLQSILGLLLGVGFGAIVGFISFAILEKRNPSSLVFFLPSGPLRVGILGAALMGLVGGVLGLITGTFGLGTLQAAAVGALMFAVLKGRTLYLDLRGTKKAIRDGLPGVHLKRRRIRINIEEVSLGFDFVLVAALVALSLPHATKLLA